MKFKKSIKKNKWTYITFISALIIISLIYTVKSIKPFGVNSMLDVDFYHQYGPLLNELRNRITENRSLLFSFNTGGGIPFYRNFLNYLSSLFNIILFLFKKSDIVMSFSIIIGLKAVMAACTMSYYLKKVIKKEGVFLVIFSLSYAFSGYFCAYYWNIMWLDGIVFLPIIMLGINRLIDDNKPLLYTIFLAVMLFANYFIGYMICLFSVMYFLAYFIYKSDFTFKNVLKKFLMFFISSFLAAGLVSFALLPLYYSIMSISATSDSGPSGALFNFKFMDFIFNHLSAVKRTVFASDELPLPNVAPGMLTLVSILFFFVNKNINRQAKLIALFGMFVFYVSFNIPLIDFIWHAFHVPNDLPYRYSFIYVFILNLIGAYGFSRIKELSRLKVTICACLVVIMALLSLKFSFVNVSNNTVLFCIIVVLCYYLAYVLKDLINIKIKYIYVFIIFICSLELFFSVSANWNIDHNIKTFMSDKKTYEYLIKQAKKDDNGLYRLEKTDYLTLNDPAWYDYNGVSTFSSMAYESVSSSQRKLGLAGNTINSYYYKYYSSPVYNTMFNIKYIMGDSSDNNYYSVVTSYDNKYLVKYNYSSSIAYGVKEKIKNWNIESYKPFLNQSEFVKLATEVENVFNPLEVISYSGCTLLNDDVIDFTKNDVFPYENLENERVTINLRNRKYENIYLYIAGANVESFNVDGINYGITSDEFYIVDIGNKDSDIIEIDINFKNSEDASFNFYAYTINDDNFKKFYDEIKNNELVIDKYSDTSILGHINTLDKKTVFTTLAYDKGWHVYVDGKMVRTFKIIDSFLAFDIDSGYHKIELKFTPVYLKEGIIISFVSLTIICCYIYFCKAKKQVKIKKIRKKIKKDEFNV